MNIPADHDNFYIISAWSKLGQAKLRLRLSQWCGSQVPKNAGLHLRGFPTVQDFPTVQGLRPSLRPRRNSAMARALPGPGQTRPGNRFVGKLRRIAYQSSIVILFIVYPMNSSEYGLICGWCRIAWGGVGGFGRVLFGETEAGK